ncbi:MAG: hypothetical protein JO230_30105 [Xanthobacteraceae bacterium]|nr:hypothetical protein [Xanthobacteraceae bacterium]
MKDFWLSSGHHLLDRGPDGGLIVTDEFLKLYLARPEIVPPADACVVERTLHAALLADPRRPVSASDIAAVVDPDARENYELLIAWRNHLLAYPTLEAAYLALAHSGVGRTPPLFLNQVVHVILRNALDRCDDPYVLRAAELLFRPQRIAAHEGALLAADEERIASAAPGPLSPLVSMLGFERAADIDVLNDANADEYWERSDAFDMAFDLTAGRRGLAALGTVLEHFIAHLLGIEVAIEPLVEANNVTFAWYVGLDAAGTKIGDALWNGDELDDADRARVIGLYQLRFADLTLVDPRVGADPVYLILAMTLDQVLRLKPQNLIVGLPIRRLETVS